MSKPKVDKDALATMEDMHEMAGRSIVDEFADDEQAPDTNQLLTDINRPISWEEMYHQSEKRYGALFDEIREVRLHTLALYEALVQQPFPADGSSMSTTEILNLLTTQGNSVIDQLRRNVEHVQSDGVVHRHRYVSAILRHNKIVGHLAKALLMQSHNPVEDKPPTQPFSDGRVNPPGDPS